MPSPEEKQDLFAAIDADGEVDQSEKDASKILYDALSDSRDELSAASEIPADDQRLSRQVKDAAAKRSAEIQGGRSPRISSATEVSNDGQPIPMYLWLLWGLALAGAGVAIYLLW